MPLLPAEVRTYELKGVTQASANIHSVNDFANVLTAGNEVAYQDIDVVPAAGIAILTDFKADWQAVVVMD